MKLMLRKIRSYQRLTARQQKFVFYVFALAIFRNTLLLIRSEKAFTETITINSNKNTDVNQTELDIALDIAKAIQLAAGYIPWRNVCRHQAWQAVYLLQAYQIPFDFKVGVKIGEASRDKGHAWVTCGAYFISGHCDINQYHVIDFIGTQDFADLRVL